MEHENFLNDDITSSHQKIDDFANLKKNTKDFLEGEQNYAQYEKFDAEKPKDTGDDDFLNFHDDLEDSQQLPEHSENPIKENFADSKMSDDTEFLDETENQNSKVNDEFLSPYTASKGLKESQNENFISSEDLLTDFKDPIEPADEIVEPEMQQQAFIDEAPNPPQPVIAQTTSTVKKDVADEPQIDAEKIFKNIGLGMY